jgi:hypothetical protein
MTPQFDTARDMRGRSLWLAVGIPFLVGLSIALGKDAA